MKNLFKISIMQKYK